ncbi:MAG: PEP-CTERM sorting domain-containing protein [Phycisphaeraceae bacterium]
MITTAALLAGLGLGTAVQADTFIWDGDSGVDSNWNTPNNWTANSGSPGAADSARWTGGSTPSPTTVDLSQAEAATDLQIVNKEVTFNLNNFALTVGAVSSTVDDDGGHAIFNGPGSVSFGATVKLGLNLPDTPVLAGHSRITAQGGATVTTSAGLTLGDYRGGGIATVDGNGTVWNNSGAVLFARTGSGNTYTQPRAQMFITDGGHFNHDTDSGAFTVASGNYDARIDVDGVGSQLNFTGNSSHNILIGVYQTSAGSTWNITDGGLVSSTTTIGLSQNNQNNTADVNTFNISGNGAKMTAPVIVVSGRSGSDVNRGPVVVNLGVGGILEGTDFDGSDRSIAVGDRGRLSLQGGTVSLVAGKRLTLRDSDGAADGNRATLEGFGTITGGHVYAEIDTRISPGVSGTGTIQVQNGNLVTLSTDVEMLWDFSTDDGSHDSLQMLADSQSATIAGLISYTNLGAGNTASGILDFVLADSITYDGASSALTAGDIPLNTDNLDSVMAAAGYTRVFSAPANVGEYRYLIATDAVGSLDALRLEIFGVIPEPASLSLLALGGVMLIRRRR